MYSLPILCPSPGVAEIMAELYIRKTVDEAFRQGLLRRLQQPRSG